MAETIEHCEACDERTPHGLPGSDGPALAGLGILGRLLGGLAIFGVGAACLSSPWPLPLVCVPLVFAAYALWCTNRKRLWHIDCQRCRYKQGKLHQDKKARGRIKLGPNTVIDPM